jgi:tripartite-type tricarboxylate transporter receptor subunit TctC
LSILSGFLRPTRAWAANGGHTARTALTSVAALAALGFGSIAWSQPAAQAPGFPAKPVRLIVSFSAGGSVDVTARLLAQSLSARWPQPVVVENKPGADGNIAAEYVTQAVPDGHTLLITSNSISITPALRKLPFDPLKDLKPIVRVLSIPNFLVAHPSLPANSVAELIALAKSKPKEVLFASSGTGTTPYMGMALLMNMTGVSMTHVPYKGTAPAVMGVLGNETPLMFGDLNSTLPHIRAGKLKALGISSASRSSLAPDIPTLAETGLPGFATATWVGIFAPAGTPDGVVAMLYREAAEVMKTPEFQQKLQGMGAQAEGDDPAQFATVMKDDIARWTQVVTSQGIKPTD